MCQNNPAAPFNSTLCLNSKFTPENMDFSDEDRILIENLYVFKGHGAKKLMKEFPNKGWGLRRLNKLSKKL